MIDEAILAINPSAVFSISAKKADKDNVDKSVIEWLDGTAPISNADIKAKMSELETADADAKAQKETDKASAKAKLIAGEPLTEEEADTIVL